MGMVSENSTVRTMRHLLKNYQPGEEFYAYQIADEIGVEPQRTLRVFQRWANPTSGILEDRGKKPKPEGLRLGPAPRWYAMTALGAANLRDSLEEIKNR